MKLSKAIEILELNIKEAGKRMPPDVLDTLKLLVEAGKRFQLERQRPDCIGFDLLPGETEED